MKMTVLSVASNLTLASTALASTADLVARINARRVYIPSRGAYATKIPILSPVEIHRAATRAADNVADAVELASRVDATALSLDNMYAPVAEAMFLSDVDLRELTLRLCKSSQYLTTRVNQTTDPDVMRDIARREISQLWFQYVQHVDNINFTFELAHSLDNTLPLPKIHLSRVQIGTMEKDEMIRALKTIGEFAEGAVRRGPSGVAEHRLQLDGWVLYNLRFERDHDVDYAIRKCTAIVEKCELAVVQTKSHTYHFECDKCGYDDTCDVCDMCANCGCDCGCDC